MSGGDYDEPAGGGMDRVPCERLHFETNLAAPNPEVVDSLKPDDVLRLVLEAAPTRVVKAMDSRGREAGAVAPPHGRFIECLQSGVSFVGIVKSVDGGAIWLEVRAAT